MLAHLPSRRTLALAMAILLLPGAAAALGFSAPHLVPVPTLPTSPGLAEPLGPASAAGNAGTRTSASPAAAPLANCDETALPLWICIGTSAKVGSITPTTDFTTSPINGADRVYFQICDEGFDHTANVTFYDQNASRDGLSNPVKQVSVPLGAGELCGGNSFDSTQGPTPSYFEVPSDLSLGGTWIINVTANALVGDEMAEVVFHVNTYYVQLTPDQTYHLPGDHATVYYQVLSYASQGPVTGALTFGVSGLYVNHTKPVEYAPTPGLTPPTGGAQGAISYTIPTNAQPDWWAGIMLWANFTGSTNSQSARLLFTIAQVIAPELCAATTTDGGPTPCTPPPTSFPLGSQVVVREVAVMGDLAGVSDAQPIAGAVYHLQVDSGGVPVPAGSFPSSATGDASGTAREVLDTSSLAVGLVTVYVNVSDPSNPTLTNDSQLSFNLTSPTQVAIQITLSSPQVFGGDSLFGNFTLVVAGGSPAPAGWLGYEYQVYYSAGATDCPAAPTGSLEEQGNLTGSSGPLPAYAVPTDVNGLLEVVVYAHNGTSATSGGIEAIDCSLASPPQIAVNPSEVNYLPGDTIGVTITPEGSILTGSGVTYYASVVGYATVTGHSPCSGTSPEDLYGQSLTSTSFSFSIPKLGASTCYEISVSAETSGGFQTGEDIEIDELSGYTLSLYVATLSQYSDGSYQPGQTLTLDYAVAALGSTTTIPSEITLLIYVGNLPYQRVQQAAATGNFPVTIPSSQGAGILLIQVVADVPSPVSGTIGVDALTGIEVEPHPSALGYELGAGSQFTVGDLIILLVIVALVVVGVFLWRRQRLENEVRHYHEDHGASGEVRSSGSPSSETTAPPAAPPVTPGPPTVDPTSLEPPVSPPPDLPPLPPPP